MQCNQVQSIDSSSIFMVMKRVPSNSTWLLIWWKLIRRQRLMYSTRVCSLVNLRVGGWGGGVTPPRLPTYPPPPTHPQLASSSTDTFKQRENQNKEKLTKVAAYEL